MNKTDLVEAVAARLGDRRLAAQAVEAVLAEIQRTVTKGEPVTIAGFGVFERRVRSARMARNPRTGQTIRVPQRLVPVFRPGAGFKAVVAAATRGASRANGEPTPGKEPRTEKVPARKTHARKQKAVRKAYRPPPGPELPTER